MLPVMSPRARLSFALWIPFMTACAADPAATEGADETGVTTTTTDGATTGPTSGNTSGNTSGDTPTTGGEVHTVPEFGGTFTVIGTSEHGLNVVRDLAFNPGAPEQLWTFNMLSHGTVIFFDPGTEQQTSEERIDAYGQHFMAYPSSAAFGDNGNFATCQESRNEWNVGPKAPDDFMGPTLWPAGAQEGSHLDMLHQAPWCMGIAHDTDNAYWTFDGKRGNLVRQDFQSDHGPGGGDHSDGIITRYLDATVTRVENVPSHMELDQATGLLYIADTGAGRIMRLDPATGTNTGKLLNEMDGADYTGVEGADFEVVVDGLDEPSGLVLHDGRILVSEHGSGDIIAFDLDGNELDRMSTPAKQIMGITIGPKGDLWYADAEANEVVRVDP